MSPTNWTIGVLLAVAAAGGLAAGFYALRHRHRTGDKLTGSTALARAFSYCVLSGTLAAAVALGPLGIALMMVALGTLGLWEWQRLGGLPLHHRVALLAANAVVVAAVYTLGIDSSPWLIGGIVLTGLLWPVIRADTGRAVRDLGFAAVGFLSIGVMLAHAVALAHERAAAGVVLVAALALACAAADVAAFVVGSRFAGTRLAPTLSPAKTRAGVAGNLAGALIGLALMSPALMTAFAGDPGQPTLLYAVLFVAVVAVGSVWGDLFESAVKREAGVKDAGDWLPGFGGILDRIDSFLLTLPLAYWSLRLLDIAGVGPAA